MNCNRMWRYFLEEPVDDMADTNGIDLPQNVKDMVRARAPPEDILAAFVAAKTKIVKTIRELDLLCAAVKVKNLKLLEFLLAKGFTVNAVKGYMRPLPIHHAAGNGDTAAVEMLLQYGADVNRKCFWDTPKLDSSFHISPDPEQIAVYNDNVACLRLLQARFDPKPKEFQQTALHFACTWDARDCLDYLLSAGTTKLNARDSKGRTPLHLAVRNASVHAVRRLITAGADVNIVDDDSRTPLHVLCARETQDTSADLDIMRLLADQPHCNVMAITRDCSRTALEIFLRQYLPWIGRSLCHSRYCDANFRVEPMCSCKEMIQYLLQQSGELRAARLQHCIHAHMRTFMDLHEFYQEAVEAYVELWIHVLTLLLDRWKRSPDNSWKSLSYRSFAQCFLEGLEYHLGKSDFQRHCRRIFQTVIRYGTKEVRPDTFLRCLALNEEGVCSTNATYFLDYFLNAHSASQQRAYLSRLMDAIDDTKFFEVTDVNAEQRLAAVKQSLRKLLEQSLSLQYMCRQCVMSLTGREDIKQLPLPDVIKDFLLCEEY